MRATNWWQKANGHTYIQAFANEEQAARVECLSELNACKRMRRKRREAQYLIACHFVRQQLIYLTHFSYLSLLGS